MKECFLGYDAMSSMCKKCGLAIVCAGKKREKQAQADKILALLDKRTQFRRQFQRKLVEEGGARKEEPECVYF